MPLSLFYIKNGKPYSWCIDCTKKKNKESYIRNAEHRKEYSRRYAVEHKEQHNTRQRLYYKTHPDAKIKSLIKSREWRRRNQDRASIRDKIWREKNKEKVREMQHKNYIKNRTKLNVKTHTNFSRLIRMAIQRTVAGKTLGTKCFRYLPYTIYELMGRLESKFTDGMSWDNYGEWHIDHIIPVRKFYYEEKHGEQFLSCWSLDNLQPLWARDNMRKGEKITGGNI